MDELNIKPLISYVQEFLIENKTDFLNQHQIVYLNPSINMKIYKFMTFILLLTDKFISSNSLLELLLKGTA